MKTMVNIKTVLYTFVIGVASVVIINGCKTPEAIQGKSGAQLWGENCIRCHNSPAPNTFSDDQWDVAAEHMRQKAILTDVEITKIRDFLKTANK